MIVPVSGGEIEPIKEAGEAAAALTEVFIDKSGAGLVPKTYFNYVAARVHYRHYPKLIERAMSAATKIKASGLPAHAYSTLDDPLLTAILESAAEEEDPDLQRVWENLLANTVTEESAEVRRSFPQILRGLEPNEVQLLDQIVPHDAGDELILKRATFTLVTDDVEAALGNLERQNLVRYTPGGLPEETYASIEDLGAQLRSTTEVTRFGLMFVAACRPPNPSG